MNYSPAFFNYTTALRIDPVKINVCKFAFVFSATQTENKYCCFGVSIGLDFTLYQYFDFLYRYRIALERKQTLLSCLKIIK